MTPMKELKLVYVPHEICFPELNIINQRMVRLIIKSIEQSDTIFLFKQPKIPLGIFFSFYFVASSCSWLLPASGHWNPQFFFSTCCYFTSSPYILNFGSKDKKLKLVVFKFHFNRDGHLCIYLWIYPALFQKILADTSSLGQCQFATCFVIWFIHTPSQLLTLHVLMTRSTQSIFRLLKKDHARKTSLLNRNLQQNLPDLTKTDPLTRILRVEWSCC